MNSIDQAIDIVENAGGYGFFNGELAPAKLAAEELRAIDEERKLFLQASSIPEFVGCLPAACEDLKSALTGRRIPGGRILILDLKSMEQTYGKPVVEELSQDYRAMLQNEVSPLPIIRFFLDDERWYETLAQLQLELAPLGYSCYKHAFTRFDLGEFESENDCLSFLADNFLVKASHKIVEERQAGGKVIYRLIFIAHECFLAFALDAYTFLKRVGTSGLAYEISATDIALKLRQWHESLGLQIVRADEDTLGVVFDRLPENLDEFENELAELCPDIDQVNYREKLIDSNYLELWWEEN